MNRESVIQKQILDYLNGLPNCKAIKVLKANEEGTPDIFCCYRGQTLILEVKKSVQAAWAGLDKQKRQTMQLRQWLDAGAWVQTVWNLDQVKVIIGARGAKI